MRSTDTATSCTSAVHHRKRLDPQCVGLYVYVLGKTVTLDQYIYMKPLNPVALFSSCRVSHAAHLIGMYRAYNGHAHLLTIILSITPLSDDCLLRV